MRLLSCLAGSIAVLGLVGCGAEVAVDPDASSALDAGMPRVDGGTVGPLPDGSTPRPDAGTVTPCVSSRECSALGFVCDTARGVCAECVAQSDCLGADEVCQSGTCVAVTRCQSSRQCNGLVCDVDRGYCVECVATVDCPSGQRCEATRCITPPPACRSDRECSALGLVCDLAASECVECVGDADCFGGRCLARRCVGVPADAGTDPVDLGTPPGDAGPAPFDAGPTPVDLGPAPVDLGPEPVDFGPAPLDLGPPLADMGPRRDAGPAVCNPMCATNATCCGDRCVDTNTDINNCGRCGAVCDPAVADTCVNSFPFPGFPASCGCGGGSVCTGNARCIFAPGSTRRQCVDTQTDERNCGSLGNACLTGETCTGGRCGCGTSGARCGGGLTCCNDQCVDTTSDAANCGACGTTCSARRGNRCVASMCRCGAGATCTAPTPQGSTGSTCCGSGAAATCVANTASSCGQCGRVCAATQQCVSDFAGSVCCLAPGGSFPLCGF